MNILIGTVLIVGAAIWLFLHLPNTEWRRASMVASVQMLKFMLPRMITALLGAGFFAELLPEDQVRQLFGDAAGFSGLLLATAMGPLTPGGAFVSFAITAAALKTGASPVAALAYVTSWSLFSLTKILAYEAPLMGRQEVIARIAVSWPVPLLVAAVGMLVY